MNDINTKKDRLIYTILLYFANYILLALTAIATSASPEKFRFHVFLIFALATLAISALDMKYCMDFKKKWCHFFLWTIPYSILPAYGAYIYHFKYNKFLNNDFISDLTSLEILIMFTVFYLFSVTVFSYSLVGSVYLYRKNTINKTRLRYVILPIVILISSLSFAVCCYFTFTDYLVRQGIPSVGITLTALILIINFTKTPKNP